jgi:DNA-binding MarR family transcriptional regulator
MASIARLNLLIPALDRLRTLYRDMTLNQVIVLIQAATLPGLTQRELCDRTGLTDSSVSRILAILSEYGNRGTEPLGLIRFEFDPADRRTKKIALTRKGYLFIEDLLKDINFDRSP